MSQNEKSESDIEQIADTIENTVNHIRESRPDDPESVSYALDDLEKQVKELQTTIKESTAKL